MKREEGKRRKDEKEREKQRNRAMKRRKAILWQENGKAKRKKARGSSKNGKRQNKAQRERCILGNGKKWIFQGEGKGMLPEKWQKMVSRGRKNKIFSENGKKWCFLRGVRGSTLFGCAKKRKHHGCSPWCFLYNENHAIVAWFKRGSADEQKANKKQGQNIFVSKSPLFNPIPKTSVAHFREPLGRELSAKLTEGLSNATEITKKGGRGSK